MLVNGVSMLLNHAISTPSIPLDTPPNTLSCTLTPSMSIIDCSQWCGQYRSKKSVSGYLSYGLESFNCTQTIQCPTTHRKLTHRNLCVPLGWALTLSDGLSDQQLGVNVDQGLVISQFGTNQGLFSNGVFDWTPNKNSSSNGIVDRITTMIESIKNQLVANTLSQLSSSLPPQSVFYEQYPISTAKSRLRRAMGSRTDDPLLSRHTEAVAMNGGYIVGLGRIACLPGWKSSLKMRYNNIASSAMMFCDQPLAQGEIYPTLEGHILFQQLEDKLDILDQVYAWGWWQWGTGRNLGNATNTTTYKYIDPHMRQPNATQNSQFNNKNKQSAIKSYQRSFRPFLLVYFLYLLASRYFLPFAVLGLIIIISIREAKEQRQLSQYIRLYKQSPLSQ